MIPGELRLIFAAGGLTAILALVGWWGERRYDDGYAAREAEMQERIDKLEDEQADLDEEQRRLTEERRRTEEARNALQRELDAAAVDDPDTGRLGRDRVLRIFGE